MTSEEYRTLFKNKILIVDDNYYHFNDKGQYFLAKGDDSVNGEYRFRQDGNQVFLITKPQIYPEGQELEVILQIGTHRVLFLNK
jgi:hypothetical protein